MTAPGFVSTARRRFVVPAFLTLCVAFFATLLAPLGWAAGGPTLTEISGDELPKTFQPNRRYTLKLLYTDPNGDTIKKSEAQFMDESQSGRTSTPASEVGGGDTSKGVVVSWDITGFEQGSHHARFQAKALAGTVNYPEEANGPAYEFVVEALSTKYIVLGVGALTGFVFVPFVTYFLFRMMNKQGDPSRAARVGLLFGILAFCALFIYQFASVYGGLTYAILILGVLGAIVLLAGGRR